MVEAANLTTREMWESHGALAVGIEGGQLCQLIVHSGNKPPLNLNIDFVDTCKLGSYLYTTSGNNGFTFMKFSFHNIQLYINVLNV